MGATTTARLTAGIAATAMTAPAARLGATSICNSTDSFNSSTAAPAAAVATTPTISAIATTAERQHTFGGQEPAGKVQHDCGHENYKLGVV